MRIQRILRVPFVTIYFDKLSKITDQMLLSIMLAERIVSTRFDAKAAQLAVNRQPKSPRFES